MQDNYGNKHTFRIRNTHCFCTATMVMRTRLYVTLYVHCLSYLYNAIRKNKMLVLYSGKVIKRKNGSADSTVNLVKLAHVWTWNKKLIFTFTGATWRILIGCQWNGKGLTYCTTVWHTVLMFDILYYCFTYCTTVWHSVLLFDILYYCLTPVAKWGVYLLSVTKVTIYKAANQITAQKHYNSFFIPRRYQSNYFKRLGSEKES